ncbi:Lysophospholipase L1 [Paenibacillus sp. UNC496MF]|uniref:SGNH/GDSL hydrolase family protein n=1 Tax=Paenibacillus sp. UNC496MF TaxID=1502753 RepID=UPI0008F22E6D|nr:SGNH/GDSL hydrolase family protein [Paenibacillus sp. UNC496MF]SFI80103.1 Lysophospholipase L1 [Paenibacillus sp. UNC496MF]
MTKLDAAHSKLREGLPRFAAKLLRGEPAAVAYLGGSITEGAGASVTDETSWRALNGRFLRERFGDSAWTFINAGVGGTTSTFGAHRLRAHALDHGPVDLLFVEFSVNDGEDRDESIRGMEGIVRQCRRLSPETELVFVYTAADKNLTDGVPFNIAVHEEVAAHYGIPSVSFAGGVRDLIRAGETTWEALAPDRVHPNDEGHALYASYANAFLEQAVTAVAEAAEAGERGHDPVLVPAEIPNAAVVPAPGQAASAAAIREAEERAGLALPPKTETAAGVGGSGEPADGGVDTRPADELPVPLDARNYEFATMADVGQGVLAEGFAPAELGPDDPLMNWRFATAHLAAAGGKRERLSFAIAGRRAGIVLLHGPDSGILEYSLDGGESFAEVNVFDEWCPLAYRPILVSFPFQPERKLQQVTIRCTGTKDARSNGTGIRVMKLLSS